MAATYRSRSQGQPLALFKKLGIFPNIQDCKFIFWRLEFFKILKNIKKQKLARSMLYSWYTGMTRKYEQMKGISK
jgi:hypothetical protein